MPSAALVGRRPIWLHYSTERARVGCQARTAGATSQILQRRWQGFVARRARSRDRALHPVNGSKRGSGAAVAGRQPGRDHHARARIHARRQPGALVGRLGHGDLPPARHGHHGRGHEHSGGEARGDRSVGSPGGGHHHSAAWPQPSGGVLGTGNVDGQSGRGPPRPRWLGPGLAGPPVCLRHVQTQGCVGFSPADLAGRARRVTHRSVSESAMPRLSRSRRARSSSAASSSSEGR